MGTSFGIEHSHYYGLVGGLIRKPVPSMRGPILKVEYFAFFMRVNSVGGYQILGVNRAEVTNRKGTVFAFREQWTPQTVRQGLSN